MSAGKVISFGDAHAPTVLREIADTDPDRMFAFYRDSEGTWRMRDAGALDLGYLCFIAALVQREVSWFLNHQVPRCL